MLVLGLLSTGASAHGVQAVGASQRVFEVPPTPILSLCHARCSATLWCYGMCGTGLAYGICSTEVASGTEDVSTELAYATECG
eukprot:849892-Rhodomonas_salina.1